MPPNPQGSQSKKQLKVLQHCGVPGEWMPSKEPQFGHWLIFFKWSCVGIPLRPAFWAGSWAGRPSSPCCHRSPLRRTPSDWGAWAARWAMVAHWTWALRSWGFPGWPGTCWGETLHPPSSDHSWWQNGRPSLQTRPAAPLATCGKLRLCHSGGGHGGEDPLPLLQMLLLRSGHGSWA